MELSLHFALHRSVRLVLERVFRSALKRRATNCAFYFRRTRVLVLVVLMVFPRGPVVVLMVLVRVTR